MRRLRLPSLLAALALVACVAPSPADDGFTGPGVAVNVAALNLAGVGDVVWDLEVASGGGQVVWQRRITSSAYGDSAGSASYVGPCDADPAVAQNWYGLQRSNSAAYSLLDGTLSPVENWYYAIGTTYCWVGPAPLCQPGPGAPPSRIVELWVR